MGQNAQHLTPDVVRTLLEQLKPAQAELVLIGGQALNVWAERYSSQARELAEAGPFTSKDIDFYGAANEVQLCAQLVGGTHELFGPDGLTAASGVVTTPEGIQIDLVRTPRGIRPDELLEWAVPLRSARVMHPIHVLESRAANVVHIPRTDEHALMQLRAAVFVVREFIRETLKERGARVAHRVNERAFRVAKSADSLEVWRAYGIDVFAAVLLVPDLGEMFMNRRYPQMAAQVIATRRASC